MSHSDSHPHSHPHNASHHRPAHDSHPHAQEAAHGHAHDACCSPAHPAAAPQEPLAAGALLLRIPAMDCPAEEAQIRRALHGVKGVRSLRFDLPARTLALEAPAHAHDAVHAALRGAGFEAERLSAPPAAQEVARARRLAQWRLGAALLVALVAELLHGLAAESRWWQLAGMAVAAVAIGLSGTAVFAKGLQALLRGQLNINALMSVAVAGAFAIGQWPEAAMVMALYALAELIEARSVERARHAIAGLLALAPPQAEVRQPDGSWSVQEARTIAPGAVARVRPGERFALDGRVTAGRGAVDQSPITGESLPVDKGVGDAVFAGTINQDGALEFEVTRTAGDTLLARILHAVEQAQSQRAPTQRFVDRFAAVYTPAVFVLALAVALGAPLVLGWPWLAALYKALVLLVIACPCALVISTPVTVVSGLAAAARRGILIKGGVYLEEARRLSVVALDKTGTLTEGRPRCVAQQVLAPAADEAQVLRIAAGLAARSDHPVAKAVAAALALPAVAVQDFAAEAGRGVRGRIEGRDYVLGNHRWIHERGQCTPELEALLAGHEAQGRTLSLLADGERVLALFAVADTTRQTSRQAVTELHALGVRTVMLTGDNAATARAIAQQVGIDDVRSLLLPQDKRQAVAQLAATQRVAMVGDGVNDAPSLAAASIGFSMGAAGTDTAKEAADVLIMDDDLRKLPETIRLSRKTSAVLWQNIALALGIKAVFFVLAMRGDATMWMAVFADMGASLLVVFNGLWLLRGVPGRALQERPA
jgi:Zn2+/Cd2+-exporting ATPase